MKEFKFDDGIVAVCDWKKTRNGFKHTASLLIGGVERESTKCCYLNRTWESYEYQSVLHKLVRDSYALGKKQKESFLKLIEENFVKEEQERVDKEFGTIAMVAKLGEVFGKDIKEKNDWKERMLKAGLASKGLIMPEDWGNLSEEDKESRLNAVIENL